MTSTQSIARACWCGARSASFIGTFPKPDDSGDWSLVQCDGCCVLALHPQPTDAELASAYSSEYYGGSPRKFIAPVAAVVSLFQGGRARMVARAISQSAQDAKGDPRRLLDVGCGNGGFLLQMQGRGFDVQGTEWTAASAARVPRESNIAVHVGDLIDLDLPPHSFDAITLWHVFEHLRSPRETLLKIRSLLNSGGVLIMSMPNAESAQAQRHRLHWFHHDPPRHLFGFGPHSLTQLLEDSGFRIQNISTWSLEQNPFGDIQSTLNQRASMDAQEQARKVGRDRLYRQLKGVSREPFTTRLADLMRMLALLPVAATRDIIESSRGEGATMTIQARKV